MDREHTFPKDASMQWTDVWERKAKQQKQGILLQLWPWKSNQQQELASVKSASWDAPNLGGGASSLAKGKGSDVKSCPPVLPNLQRSLSEEQRQPCKTDVSEGLYGADPNISARKHPRCAWLLKIHYNPPNPPSPASEELVSEDGSWLVAFCAGG